MMEDQHVRKSRRLLAYSQTSGRHRDRLPHRHLPRQQHAKPPASHHGCRGLPALHLRSDHLLPGAARHRGLHHSGHRPPRPERQQNSVHRRGHRLHLLHRRGLLLHRFRLHHHSPSFHRHLHGNAAQAPRNRVPARHSPALQRHERPCPRPLLRRGHHLDQIGKPGPHLRRTRTRHELPRGAHHDSHPALLRGHVLPRPRL